MKNTYIAIIVSIFTLLNYSLFAQNDTLEKIEIYYLPWNLKTPGRLSNTDVRNFNNGRNYTFTITEDSLKTIMFNSLSIFNLRLLRRDSVMDVRMVIDFHFKNNIETISLNHRKLILYKDNLYFINHELVNLLDSILDNPTRLK